VKRLASDTDALQLRGSKFGHKQQEEKMTTEEVAKKVVELVRKQAWYDALDTLYDQDVVSVEATAPESRGKEAVRSKIDWWVNAMEVHSFKASEPFVAHDRFVVQYDADVTEKESKQRRQIFEVGVYTVKNGKIVREEFLPRL
jgi:SnoaL-like domain